MAFNLEQFAADVYAALGKALGKTPQTSSLDSAPPRVEIRAFPLAPEQGLALQDPQLLELVGRGPWIFYGYNLNSRLSATEIRAFLSKPLGELEAHAAAKAEPERLAPEVMGGLLAAVVNNGSARELFTDLANGESFDFEARLAAMPPQLVDGVKGILLGEGLVAYDATSRTATLTKKGQGVWQLLVDASPVVAGTPAVTDSPPAEAAPPAEVEASTPPPAEAANQSPPPPMPPTNVSTLTAFPLSIEDVNTRGHEQSGKAALTKLCKNPAYGLQDLDLSGKIKEVRAAVTARLQQIQVMGGPVAGGAASTTEQPPAGDAPPAEVSAEAAPAEVPPAEAPPAEAPPVEVPTNGEPKAKATRFFEALSTLKVGEEEEIGPEASLWAFRSPVQRQCAIDLQGMLQAPQTPDEQDAYEKFAKVMECARECTKCPHGPAQPKICYLLCADETPNFTIVDIVQRGAPLFVTDPTYASGQKAALVVDARA